MTQCSESENDTQHEGLYLRDLLERVEHDRELLADLLQVFVQEFPSLLQLLKDSVAHRDAVVTQASAHTLKGMFATLSFVHAAATAVQIERMARILNFDGIPPVLQLLERQAAIAERSLQQVCSGPIL